MSGSPLVLPVRRSPSVALLAAAHHRALPDEPSGIARAICPPCLPSSAVFQLRFDYSIPQPRPGPPLRAGPTGCALRQKAFWCAEAQVRVIGNLRRPPPGAFAQISFRLGLQTPGDAPEQKLPVRGPRFFSKYLAVPGSLWSPGDEICWVEFIILDGITYIEDTPSRWLRNATIV